MSSPQPGSLCPLVGGGDTETQKRASPTDLSLRVTPWIDLPKITVSERFYPLYEGCKHFFSNEKKIGINFNGLFACFTIGHFAGVDTSASSPTINKLRSAELDIPTLIHCELVCLVARVTGAEFIAVKRR